MTRRTTRPETSSPSGDGSIADALGIVHPPAGPAPRIASLVPSLTELLFALGLGDRIVARTRFCIHPADRVATVPAIGGTKKVHLERLRALAPTHAILDIDENTKAMAEEIRTFVPHVIVTHPRHPDDNRHLYRQFGQVFARKRESDSLYTVYNEVRAAIQAESGILPARQVVYLIWQDPWMTISRETYIAAMLGLVNWHTLGHDPARRYPEIAITPALVAQADLFLFSSEPYAFTDAHLDEFAEAHDCPRDKLRLIDGEYCSWYGSRAIDGLRYLRDLARTLA